MSGERCGCGLLILRTCVSTSRDGQEGKKKGGTMEKEQVPWIEGIADCGGSRQKLVFLGGGGKKKKKDRRKMSEIKGKG